MKTKTQTPLEALCEATGSKPDDFTEESHDHYGLTVYREGRIEWAIGTDTEADEACLQAVESSLWAFNADFILEQCDLPGALEDAIRAFQEKKCEDANDAILALVEKTCGIEKFARRAMSADGRGHFLSTYDGNEMEEGEFYIYRIN